MLKKKKTTASGKLVMVKSVRRTRSHRMKFCVQRGLGALPSTSKQRGKSQRDFLLCGPVCINTGIGMVMFGPLADILPLQWIMIGSGIALIVIAGIAYYSRELKTI